MARLRYNGLRTTLGASLTNSATSVTFAAALTHSNGTNVPTITGSDYIPLVILDSSGHESEIVWLTAYTAAATTGTITRGQEGTTGVSHSSGDAVICTATAADLDSGYSSYTPVLTAATTNPTLGTGSTALGQYAQDNKTVTGQGSITFGSSGVVAGSGQYAISLPVTADTTIASQIIGTAVIYDSSTGDLRIGSIAISTSTTAKIYYPATNGLIGATVPWTWAASDNINFAFTYRAA